MVKSILLDVFHKTILLDYFNCFLKLFSDSRWVILVDLNFNIINYQIFGTGI